MQPDWSESVAPLGNQSRFGRRWRLIGAGLSNVWRYGDLQLAAPSGRLLLRGPNGTGKTTALEVLWPYLLDMNAMRLAAGRARNTHLSSLMREAADGRRRVGYVWLTFAPPDDQPPISYGARLNFSEGGAPPVKVVPFSVPGRPLHELPLWGPGRTTPSVEEFGAALAGAGGTAFDDPEDYVRDLATRVFVTDPGKLSLLAERIRQVRNPALLGELSPREAADALRASLPAVSDEVIEATGEALAESDATRRAFEADREAADVLAAFARAWTGHAVAVTADYQRRAADAADVAAAAVRNHRRLVGEHHRAVEAADRARQLDQAVRRELDATDKRRAAIEQSDPYRAAGRLTHLAATVGTLGETAAARWETLEAEASKAADLAAADLRRIRELADDIGDLTHDLSSLVTTIAVLEPLRWRLTPRPPYRVGHRQADAGPELLLTPDLDALARAVAALMDRAEGLLRAADLAGTFVTAFGSVEAVEREAMDARAESGRLARVADELAQTFMQEETAARAEATALRAAIHGWLAELEVEPPFDWQSLDQVDWSDPSMALFAGDECSESTAEWAHAAAAEARALAVGADSRAETLARQAGELRAEVERIRSREDVVLPLPRPDWAGPGDDSVALGAAVDWRDDVDRRTQDVVEATVAAAGLLGATMSAMGASTATWTVDVMGPVVEPSLGSLLVPDPAHPRSREAAEILARIPLLADAAADDPRGLVIGTDGSFRAGVLAASVPEARDDAVRRPARHIGARRRRQAALAHATTLDADAGRLDGESEALRLAAVADRAIAARALEILGAFPERDGLRDAEAGRVAAAKAKQAADARATKAEHAADELTQRASDRRTEWSDTVVAAGWPADAVELGALIRDSRQSERRLRSAAAQLDGRFRERITAVVEAVAGHDASLVLAARHAEAVEALTSAEAAQAEHEELVSQLGRTGEEVLARHAEVKAKLVELRLRLRTADKTSRECDAAVADRGARVEAAKERLDEAGPAAAEVIAELRRLLALPGVAEAVLGVEVEPRDGRLLAQVASAVAGKATAAKRTVRDRADETTARLAGIWSLDPGVDHPELITYHLTHGAEAFTPLAGARCAGVLAERAEQALRAADEAALQEFVIGRLPAAIAQAWTRLFDWVGEVNAKLRSAAASSGVGVAVRVSVREDLPPLIRTVYELACKTGAALRDPDAKGDAGTALHQLIYAAIGDDMTARVREAVDVREWVDVAYQVTRPNESPRNWNSRTGLSGGERRLVVLAPMLAAVAAAYDQLPARAARLAALDEVPSEVDDEGREGLARYIAELDLDLIATSHHWDGAPGAWDGIDIHDLEAAPDGTVVAFPMLLRGRQPLPGDFVDVLPTV